MSDRKAMDDRPLDPRSRKSHRRRVIVDRELQLGLAGRAALFTFSMICLISVALFLPLVREMTADRGQTADVDSAVVLLYLHERFWPLALGAVMLSALLSILTSHRIAGPLVRVKRNLWAIARGEVPQPLQTRQRDFLKAEVDALNAAAQGIEAKRRRLRDAVTEMRSQVEHFGPPRTVLAQLEIIERELAQAAPPGPITPQSSVEGRPEPIETPV